MRVDRETGVLARKSLLGLRQAEPLPNDVHQVGRIGAVEDVEARIEPEPLGVQADQAIADRVKRPGPGQAQRRRYGRRCPGAHRRRDRPLRPARHLERSAAGKGQEQHALRRNTREEQIRHAVREGARLARAGACDHEQRTRRHAALGFRLAVPDSLALGGVERVEIVRGEHRAEL